MEKRVGDHNVCAKLNVEDIHSKVKDPLQFMLNTQFSLQEKLKNKKDSEYAEKFGAEILTEDVTLDKLADHTLIQKQCIDDEIQELLEALGGKKYGNSVWKYWKSAYTEIKTVKLKDLSVEELLEARYEFIDIMHFILNIGLSLGLTSKDIVNLYAAKNKENFDRQDRNY